MFRSVSCLIVIGIFAAGAVLARQGDSQWGVHDMARPKPKVVKPGKSMTEIPAPPGDAIVLFDGSSFAEWQNNKGETPTWKIENGAMVVTGGGGINTKRSFGSCQLHVEWATPSKVSGQGQGRGNSGVFLMGRYEVQVLDSYENETYADGQAASIYGQNPPLVNVCRGPGEWQSYDIVFHRPTFDEQGNCSQPATITVLHNGVLVQDHFELWGTTAHKRVGTYSKHADALPISLQDHGNPMRFRNIWVRPLE